MSWLFALAAKDLSVDLISTGVEQVHRPILQCPKVAIESDVFITFADALTRNQLRGFEP
jgi:hypothetical protein